VNQPVVKSRPAFYVILGLLVATAALMLLPFVTPVLVAAVLGYLLLPFYDYLGRFVRNPEARAAFLLLLVLFVLALPVVFALVEVSIEAPSALRQTDIVAAAERLNAAVDRTAGFHVPLAENFATYAARVREAVLHAAPTIVGRLGSTALGLLLLLYTLFYVFTEGREVWADFVGLIPLDPAMKPHLVDNIQSTMTGVLYGQVVTAALQAALAAVGYFVFGLSHVILWTFLTMIAAMVPVVGAAMIWVPLAASQLLNGDRVGGWGLVLYMGVLVSMVDHIVKPRLIAGRSALHPLAALFGVIGGLHMFGVTGFILGPVLLGLLSAMLRFYREMTLVAIPAKQG
jgi:predicted PurR-regulated permease PerM